MLGLQDLLGLSGRERSVLRLVLVGEQVQPAQRLSGRGQGPALLDLLQERPVHDDHHRHPGPTAAHHRQDSRARDREPADPVGPIPMRFLRPRQDPDHERLEKVVRRQLYHTEDRPVAVDTAGSASLHGEALRQNDQRT